MVWKNHCGSRNILLWIIIIILLSISHLSRAKKKFLAFFFFSFIASSLSFSFNFLQLRSRREWKWIGWEERYLGLTIIPDPNHLEFCNHYRPINVKWNQEEPSLLILGFSREDSRKKELIKGKKSDVLLQKIKITRNRKQVASHHSRESLSFWNHIKYKELSLTFTQSRYTFFIK